MGNSTALWMYNSSYKHVEKETNYIWNVTLHPNICVDIYDNIHGDCPDIYWKDAIWPIDMHT